MPTPRICKTSRPPRRSPAQLQCNPGSKPHGFATLLRPGQGFTLLVRVMPWPQGLSVHLEMLPHTQLVEQLDLPPE